MPISTLDEYKQSLVDQRQFVPVTLGTLATIAGRTYDTWLTSAPAGTAPTAAVVPTNTTTGSLGQLNPSGGTSLGIIGARFNGLNPGNYVFADRLAHSGGLSGIVTTAQTTNLPTPALTRSVDGLGVMIGLTIYTAIGTTGTTVTCSYTNELGVGGRTTTAVVFGGTGFREAGRLIILPWQDEDLGCRSVQSITVLGTTGTAGNFGVTLFKPIYVVAVTDVSGVLSAGGFITGNTFGGVNTLPTDSCIFPIAISTGTNSAGAGALIVEEI